MKYIVLILYLGGKHTMLNEILKRIDYSKMCYIDLFGGSGAVAFNKKLHKVNIYNDINDDLTNLFLQIKYNKDKLVKELNELPISETFFYEMLKKYKNKDYKDDFEKAIIYAYLSSISFSSSFRSFGYAYTKDTTYTYRNRIKNIDIAYERIKKYQILNKDYKNILSSIAKRDNKDIMIYVDPPYYNTEFYYDKYKFTEEDHELLSHYLNKFDCSVMISYSYFDGIEKLYPKDKWQYFSKLRQKTSCYRTNAPHSSRDKIEELIITNYTPVFNELIRD